MKKIVFIINYIFLQAHFIYLVLEALILLNFITLVNQQSSQEIIMFVVVCVSSFVLLLINLLLAYLSDKWGYEIKFRWYHVVNAVFLVLSIILLMIP